MHFTATLTYDKALLRKAAFAFWRRSVGVFFPLVLLSLSGYLAVQAVTSRRDWLWGAMTASVLLGYLVCGAVFVVHYRSGLTKLRDMGSPIAEFTAQDDSFTLTSSIGTACMKWSSVTGVWRFESFWLLLFSRANFSTLPLQNVTPEMQSFVLDRIRSFGGKVDG